MQPAIKRPRGRRDKRSRKGAMLVLVTLMLIILIAAAAFSTDLAYMFLAREELHIATDAACKAAVTKLAMAQAGGIQDLVGAKNLAKTVAGLNFVCGGTASLSDDQITLGHVEYNSTTKKWDFYATPCGNKYMAAQVTAQLPVPLFFGKILGVSSFTPTGHSEAAFVRNKWCLVFDRSGSMAYDMTGIDRQYPTGPITETHKKKVWDDPWHYHWEYYEVTITRPWTEDDPPHPDLSRWAALVEASTGFLNCVATSPVENRVGMVTFGTYADTGSTRVTFSTSYTPITTRLTTIGLSPLKEGTISTTNLKAGLQEALDLFQDTDDGTPWNKIIVVLSDGIWNTGGDPTTVIPSLQAAGITCHTIGLLPGGDNDAMHQIAAQTGGRALQANDEDELIDSFTALTQTIPVILTK
jgi:Ca-activated chloride channel homolog